MFNIQCIVAVINNWSAGRGGGAKGSSIRPKTFGAPFSSNWHQRLVAPQLANPTEDWTTGRNTKTAAVPSALKDILWHSKGLKTYFRVSGRQGSGAEREGEQ